MNKTYFFIVSAMIFLSLSIILHQSCRKDDDDGGNGNNHFENQPPACTITFPENAAAFTLGDTVRVGVDANDADGTISYVKFFVNGFTRIADSSEPYLFVWNTSADIAGEYVVRATAFDNMDTSRSDEITINLMEVITGGPIAEFKAAPLQGHIPLTVSFTDLSTNIPDKWSWDFGDGYMDENQHPVHTFTKAGAHTVTLTVSNEHGSDTRSRTEYVEVWVNPGTSGSFTDPRDGEVYSTIEIGSQLWFAENLRYETENSWYYENNIAYKQFGRLYTWLDALQACPEGWHLSQESDWNKLEIYLGMSTFETAMYGYRGTVQGKMLKATEGWHEGGNGNNASGFNAIGSGARYGSQIYRDLYEGGRWWSGYGQHYDQGLSRSLRYNENRIGRHEMYTNYGLSVRCVKDE